MRGHLLTILMFMHVAQTKVSTNPMWKYDTKVKTMNGDRKIYSVIGS